MFSLILTVMMCLVILNEKKNLGKISLYIYAHSRSRRSQTDFSDWASALILRIQSV